MAIKDIAELDELVEKNPDWPLWRVLAHLGWAPPATWQSTITHCHDLEVRIRDLEKGVSVRPRPEPDI